MGEQEEKKKPEESPNAEEKSKENAPEAKKPEPDGGNNKSDESPPPPPSPPPPQEIILKVFMHCEGCARKVRACLKGFQGVEEVKTDCKASQVTVKGEKADPMKVLERVQRKSHRKVELISPVPKPPTEEPQKKEEKEPKPDEGNEKSPPLTVVLSVCMHCDACAQEIKKRILRMKGVESVDPDLKSSRVTVKGVFEPEKLVEYVYRRTGKQATIINEEPEKKEESKPKEDKDAAASSSEQAEKEGKKDDSTAAPAPAEPEDPKFDMKKNELYYYYPQNMHFNPMKRFMLEDYTYHAPQMFSDENPNACSVM